MCFDALKSIPASGRGEEQGDGLDAAPPATPPAACDSCSLRAATSVDVRLSFVAHFHSASTSPTNKRRAREGAKGQRDNVNIAAGE